MALQRLGAGLVAVGQQDGQHRRSSGQRAGESWRSTGHKPFRFGHAGNLPLLSRWTFSRAATSSASACARRWARPAAPPWSAFLAALAFPSAERGPVDATHGFQLAISAACLARAASVHLGMIPSLKSSFWCAVRSYSAFLLRNRLHENPTNPHEY